MRFLVNERLSEHRYKTPEGYLVCTDAILARTGPQTYRRNEVFVDSDDDSEIEIDRKPEEVFSDKTLASFENKPITVEHPDEDVNVHNHKEYAVGFVRDVRRGKVDGQEVMLGNLVITDEKTIQEIEDGEHTDLSCGYDCDIIDEENPQQRNIRGNHVALCEQGRAGIARIVDSINDAKYHVGYVDRYDQACYVRVDAKDEKEAEEKIQKAYKPYRIFEVRKVSDSANNIIDSVQDAQIFYALHTKYNDTYIATNLDFIKRMHEAKGGDIYEVNDNFEYYKQTQSKWGQRALWDEIFFAIRNGKAKKINNNVIDGTLIGKATNEEIKDVEPRKGESQEDFISRFMSETKEEYPDEKQRLAVAYSYWRKAHDSINDEEKFYTLNTIDPGEIRTTSITAKSEKKAVSEYERYISKRTSGREVLRILEVKQVPNTDTYSIKYRIETHKFYVVKAKSESEAKAKLIKENNKLQITKIELASESDIRAAKFYYAYIDSVNDELVDIPNAAIEEFKNIVKSHDFEIEGSGHTMFGRLHFQIASKRENYTKAEFDKIYKEITAAFKKFEDKYARGGRFPITWNFGLTYNGRITAGIDLDKILTK